MDKLKEIREIIIEAKEKAEKETAHQPEPQYTGSISWPVTCSVGPGLEGAIACESKVGYVNGEKGWLIYRGYNIFDLAAHSNFEETSYLLLHGRLPFLKELTIYNNLLKQYRNIPYTIRLLMGFPIENMSPMACLRLGTNLMRQELTVMDKEYYTPSLSTIIGTDEDSIAMETKPKGEKRAVYEFDKDNTYGKNINTAYHLISGVSTVLGAIAAIKRRDLPLNPSYKSHAFNLLYMITGKTPDIVEERIMDIALILHADHGMNASTFASLVVASTLSDMYFAVGSGIAALNGPLHGGANERVLKMLKEIGEPSNVKKWFEETIKQKRKIMGFGHRVYKAYDPRARILGPLAKYLIRIKKNQEAKKLFSIAQELEKRVVGTLGVTKKIFPNVDFYSGLVYYTLGIPASLFTPIFAASRVSGWTARIIEYLEHNRIFRPRAIYNGEFNKKYISLAKRK